MKRFVLGLSVLVGIAILWQIRKWQPGTTPSTDSRTEPSAASGTSQDNNTASPVTLLPIADAASTLHSPNTSPTEDLATLDLLLIEFRKQLGGNPVGDNGEITAALLGNNQKCLGFLPASIPAIDSSGLLIDRWGTPFFFHAIAADHMEITSAGPDRQFYTDDDISGER